MKKYLPICIIVLLSVVCLSIYGKEDKKEETNTIKENDNRFTIAAYINGVFSDTMPTESKYFGYVECKDNSGNKLDTLGFVEWENNKWNVRITDITKASTCNVYFIDPPAHWLDAENGTLLKAIKDNNKVENVKTIPGKQINKTDEAVLSGTIDDYGTSYYFRGAVKDNYVVFANKCWRIVRITGDGSIKLTLYNRNGGNCSNMSPFALYDGENSSTQYNARNNRAYIGFMYGELYSENITDYNTVNANVHDSIALSHLKDWYDFEGIFTSEEKELLADVIWCNDKSTTLWNNTGNNVSYGIYPRLINNNSPSLVCPATGLDGKLSKFTAYDKVNGNGDLNGYKIGLLTADEVVFAGAKYGTSYTNSTYYLKTGSSWWTMTPYIYNSSKNLVTILSIFSNNFLISNDYIGSSMNLRPAIALPYNVQIISGDGKIDTPYLIKED